MVDIAVTAETDETEPVNLGAFSYVFRFPKSAPLLASISKIARMTDEDEQGLASMEARYAWLERGFGPDQWAHIQGRLDDDADPLDTPHMGELFQQLFQVAGKRPPTSRGVSSTGTPQTQSPEAKPNPYASTAPASPSIVSATS